MKSKRMLLACSLLIAGLCAAPVSAQPENGNKQDGARQRGPRDGQRRDRPEGRGGRMRGADAQLKSLTEGLKLNDAQQKEIGELLKSHETQMREIRESFRPTDEDRAEMERIRDDMMRAREENDQELLAQCRERMRAVRQARNERMAPAREQMQAAEAKLHDEVLAKLNEEQRGSFEEVWAKTMNPRGGRANPQYDPRLLQRAVMRVKGLTSEQESTIEKLFKDFREKHPDRRQARGERNPKDDNGDKPETRRDRRRGRGVRNEAAGKKLYEDVMKQLTDEQKKEVEATLERARGRRGERDPRGARDGRDGPGRFRDGNRPPREPADDGDLGDG